MRVAYYMYEDENEITVLRCDCCNNKLIMSPRNRMRVVSAIRLRADNPMVGGAVINIHKQPYEVVELLDDDVPASLIRRIAECAEELPRGRVEAFMRRQRVQSP